MPNSVTEQGEIIDEVFTTEVDVCDVTAGNNVETANVTYNDDKAFLDRFKECIERHESICAAQQAIELELINSIEDIEVYNKIGADGKTKKVT